MPSARVSFEILVCRLPLIISRSLYGVREIETMFCPSICKADNGSAEIWTDEHISLKLNRLSVEQAMQVIGLLNQKEKEP